MRRVFISLVLLLLPFQAFAEGRFSTYLEGTVVRKSADEWILATDEGTYWISMYRPPSWKRTLPNGQVSFWVHVNQIRKIRPNARPLPPVIETEGETAVAQK